ncbi:MAG: tRNA (adenosine(37)-N6)-threonylcarbamoyltransferase complex transferase subunit TsaD [Ruminococcaceae bacterium]|nr:tRNA (adenosine(37)-N6)-threonylcarbamoyltransferase complex transferase subunit TsaD [Oscillospiraceae bacterium]
MAVKVNILAIESSCDETAAAVVADGKKILSDIVYSQVETHSNYGGVVPEVASRMHSKCISEVVEKAVEQAGLEYSDIDAVAVTYAPGLIGALLTGVSFAKGLSTSLKRPIIPVHHIRGHIAANYIENPQLKPPFMCLVASGGHSHIVLVKDYTDFEIIGKTRDDAAGEAYDKTARILGLSYPGGPSIDKLSKKGNPDALKLPRVSFDDNPFDFSFSGVKTAVNNLVHNIRQKGGEIADADIAASFNKTVCETLMDKAVLACVKNNVNVLCIAGGVAANSYLREYANKLCTDNKIELFIPSVKYCGDNAVMIGVQAFFEFKEKNLGDKYLNACANMSIEKSYQKK